MSGSLWGLIRWGGLGKPAERTEGEMGGLSGQVRHKKREHLEGLGEPDWPAIPRNFPLQTEPLGRLSEHQALLGGSF